MAIGIDKYVYNGQVIPAHQIYGYDGKLLANNPYIEIDKLTNAVAIAQGANTSAFKEGARFFRPYSTNGQPAQDFQLPTWQPGNPLPGTEKQVPKLPGVTTPGTSPTTPPPTTTQPGYTVTPTNPGSQPQPQINPGPQPGENPKLSTFPLPNQPPTPLINAIAQQPVQGVTPYPTIIAANPNLPSETLTKPQEPNESDQAYLQRQNAAQFAANQAASERNLVTGEATAQEAKQRNILNEQSGLQQTRLNDLAKLLAAQQDAQFNRDIPGIAETAQGGGFLETSGFGNALANRYRDLSAQTSEKIAQQGLTDRDLAIAGLSDISKNATSLGTAGLQRQFSTTDTNRSEALARELAPYGVMAPSSSGPSDLQQITPLLGVAASLIKPTHFCTHMRHLGLLSNREVVAIHKFVYPVLEKNEVDQSTYNESAPRFIAANPSFNWAAIKPRLYDATMACATPEEAYAHYKSICLELFATLPINELVGA